MFIEGRLVISSRRETILPPGHELDSLVSVFYGWLEKYALAERGKIKYGAKLYIQQ